MTRDEAEAALQAWATVQRDELVQAAHQAGVSKNRIYTLTGIARTTINRILEDPVGATQQAIAGYLSQYTAQWPRQNSAYQYGGYLYPPVSGQRTPGEIAGELLADADFEALRLGTWLSTPDGELLAAAVEQLSPPPYREDAELLIEALKLAAREQQSQARKRLAVGGALIGAIIYGVSQA